LYNFSDDCESAVICAQDLNDCAFQLIHNCGQCSPGCRL